ncbi:dTDP-4-dehydrorhamnose reductase [Winogradskyella sp. 3972H.M.0a.05]|uniref:dTDP-4-dehydrorhamnose reductase n=1 Tax=Winogradskyella sp. 3972H.M.0a.05 TaxID=2950277 RepID=UPI0033958296
MKTVLVTGAGGQLGQSIKAISDQYGVLNFIYRSSTDLDITNYDEVSSFFDENAIDWCVNCAAYTAVDKAETQIEQALKINEKAVENLALTCKKANSRLIHISTDFVFDGSTSTPYLENDNVNPINKYGETKLKGEEVIRKILSQHYIIRTSWLYSEFGSNFMKTMIKLSRQNKTINVVNDQIGTPTYANNLAQVICKFMIEDKQGWGTYHYSNLGSVSWYGFAKEIFSLTGTDIQIAPVSTEEFNTAAIRPKYSVLDKTKIKRYLQIDIPHWRESLKECISNYSLIENNK